MLILTAPLTEEGPVVDVLVDVTGPRRAQLSKHNFPVPERVRVRVLLDTGSAVTAFDPEILRGLDLRPLGTVRIHTPSTGQNPHSCNEYDVSLSLLYSGGELHFPLVPVVESEFVGPDGIKGLIGRSILSDCLFVYNGPEDLFSLAF
jgi:hypothetical protein